MGAAIDDEIAKAIQVLWKSQKDLAGLCAEPLRLDRLHKEPGKRKQSVLMPYVQLEISKGRESERRAGARIVLKDFRTVTLTAVGLRAQVVDTVSAILEVFNGRLGYDEDREDLILQLPTGVRFGGWWPNNDGEITQDETTKDAQDIYRGVVKGEVCTIRTM